MVLLDLVVLSKGENSCLRVPDAVLQSAFVQISIGIKKPSFLVESGIGVMTKEPTFFLFPRVVLNHSHFLHRLVVGKQAEEDIKVSEVE